MPRRFVSILLGAFLLTAPVTVAAQGARSMKSIYEVPIRAMESAGETSTSLAPYKGSVVLVVNVASKCGYTPQYEGLEALYEKYKGKGLVIVGFPCNDFGGQEPGSENEIMQFCRKNYGVTFPMMAKLHTTGGEKAALYHYLTDPSAAFPGDVKWNFEKFLVSRDGRVVQRFRSGVRPDAPELVKAVETELARKP